MSQDPRRLALAALLIGLLSIPTAGFLGCGGVLAIALGTTALVRIRREEGEQPGQGLAVAGILAGFASLLLIPFLVGAYFVVRDGTFPFPIRIGGGTPAESPAPAVTPPPPLPAEAAPPAPEPTAEPGMAGEPTPEPTPALEEEAPSTVPTPRPRRSPPPRATPAPAQAESEAPPPPTAAPAPPPAAAAGPVRVGGSVREPAKVKNVAPRYPEVARRARVQGVVILEVTIDEAGRVSDVKVLRSIPLLDEAAVEAVRQWVYTPTRIDGRPVSVLMTVTVNFKLG